MMETKEHTIEAALLALHSRDDDMARYANNVGFNGRDTGFGNSLAFQIKKGVKLSPKQLAAAHRMLRTYKVQLLRDHGIDYGQIPAPESAPKDVPADVTGEARMSEDGAVVVKFTGFPGELLADVKRIPGARYDRATQEWLILLTVHTAPWIEAFDPRIVVGQDVKDAIAGITKAQIATQEASRATEADIPLAWSEDLYGFQRAGVAYALEHRRTFIGDEMGLGKTVQAIATVEVADAYPVLIVVPAVVKLNWQRELNRWVPGRTVEVVEGRKPYPLTAEVVVINYDLISFWQEALTKAPWQAVVFDESHYLKNGKAKRTKAAKAISHTVPIRLMLTGTPILNRPVELVAQLEVLGRLTEFGGFWPFVTRYCDARQTQWGLDAKGASNLGELHERLTGSCLVRRTKEQVLGDLPAKQRASVPVEFNRTEYDEVERDLKVWLKARILAEQERMRRVRELSRADEMDEAEAEAEALRKERAMGRAALLVKIEALKQTAARGKLPVVVDWVKDFLESGSKLVVFAHHKEIVSGLTDAIREAGYGVVTLTGDTKAADRQGAVDAFQNDEDVRLFVGNMQAAGVGITLTKASDVAFVELPWRPGDLTQAEDRCHRIGQSDSVTCWYLLAANTIEETVAKMIDRKRQVVDHVTDGKTAQGAGESLAEALMDALEEEVQ